MQHAAAIHDGVGLERKEQVRIGADDLAHGEKKQSLRAANHPAGGDVVARPMPWTLKAAVTQDAALAERCKQVSARVRDCKRAAVRDAHCQTPDRRFHGDDAGASQLRAGDQAVQTRTARRASGSGWSWCRELGAFRGTSLRRTAFRAGALRRHGRGVELDDADIAAAVCSCVDCGWCHVHLHVLRLTNADDTATYPDRCSDARRSVCAQSLTCTAGSSTVNSVPRRGSEATATDPPW